MVSRPLTWTATVAAAVLGFAAARSLAKESPARPVEAAAPAAPPPPSHAPAAVAAPTPAPLGTTPPTAPSKPLTGLELYQQVNEAYPDLGRATWPAINNSVTRLLEAHVRAHGDPATACAPDGALDDAILTVHWTVSTDVQGVHVRGGRLAIDQFPEALHACVDGYLAKVEGDFPSRLPLAELDLRYQWPMPAKVVLARPPATDGGAAPAAPAPPAPR
ncbi:MAG: hypothetical protein IPL61_29520 [Myxococcales bacterium]|nr:hypothetical protein [Myxococcales bacterium]